MKQHETQSGRRRSRRRFLKAAGVGAAASLAIPAARAAQNVSAESRGERRSSGEASRPLKLGLASYSLRKFSLDEALAMTKRVALDWICLKSFHLPLNATPQQIAEAAAKAKEAGITLYGGGVIQMRNEEQVNQAFAYAEAAGMTTIVGVPAPDVLPLVDEKVKQHDFRVAIHNHGPGDKVYPTRESAYETVKGFGRRIGLCIDVGHTVRVGADPILDARRFADRLHDVHVKDVSAAAPEGRNIEMGRGVVDVPGFLEALIETGYSGIVSFEFEKDADDPLPGLAESVGYVRGVLDAI
ncbi:MAG: sugar phosphate isomerase/epimerase family protein [Planctomycetota bacterium]|jgi:sugar phosphate isomerase/epimerase